MARDILLIQPPAFGEFSPPLGLASLSAYLKANELSVKAVDYNIKFFNVVANEYRHAWKISQALTFWNDPDVYRRTIQPRFRAFARRVVRDILEHDPQYVGISVLETCVQASFDLIEVIREYFGPGIRIVVGGPEIGKERAKEYLSRFGVYCAFHGEAELGLAKLLKQTRLEGQPNLKEISGAYFLENGDFMETPGAMVKDLDTLPFPDFSDFNLKEYAFREQILPITTSRGCIAKCSFCGETNFMNRFRQLSAPRIVAEFKNGLRNYDAKVFRLNDSLINGNLKVLEGWLDEIIANDIKIVFGGAQARINTRMSDELLRKLKRAGCQVIQYGVETGSNRLLAIMRKGIKTRDVHDVVKRTHAAGLTVQINLIVGHFEETWLDYLKTLWMIFRLRKELGVVAVNLYAFDKFSADTQRATGIINRFSEKWRTENGLNNYALRRFKRSIILLMMKAFGIRYP